MQDNLDGYENIKLLPPVSYDQMLALLKRCDLVISDSGGIQEEAPAFKKPVIVTREFTERQEAVEAGFSTLTGANSVKILKVAKNLLKNTDQEYERGVMQCAQLCSFLDMKRGGFHVSCGPQYPAVRGAYGGPQY